MRKCATLLVILFLASYASADYLELIDNSGAGPVNQAYCVYDGCYQTYKFTRNETTSIQDIDASFIKFKNNKDVIIGTKDSVRVGVITNIEHLKPVYELYQEQMNITDNETQEVTYYYVDMVRIINYTTYYELTISYDGELKIKNAIKDLENGEHLYFRVEKYLLPGDEVDVLPNMPSEGGFKEYEQWAWFNTSLGFSMEFNGSSYIDGLPFFANLSILGAINAAQLANSSTQQPLQYENESGGIAWGLWNGTNGTSGANEDNLTIFHNKGVGDSDDYLNTTIGAELLAWYHFNSGLNDSSGNDINISPVAIASANFGNGRFGQALVVRGPTLGRYYLTKSLGDIKTQDWTIEFWMNNSDDYQSVQYALYLADSGYIRCETHTDTCTGAGDFCCYVFDGAAKIVNVDDALITANTWYHIAWVFNTSDNMAIFLDGAFQDSIAIGALSDPNGENVLGGHYANGNTNWNGSIDEFRIWNRALSTEDIAALYNNYMGINEYAILSGVENAAADTDPPSIFNITLVPNLNITFNSNYNITANITDDSDIDNVTVYYMPINGDDISCHEFLANGSCLHTDNLSSKMFNVSTADIFFNSSISYHGTILGISYADETLFEDNAPNFTDVYRSTYHILNITNNFSTTINTTFKFDIDVREKAGTTKTMRLYLIGGQPDIAYMTSDWRLVENTSLIHSIPSGTPFDYTDGNGSYYETIIQSNPDGLFTNESLNLSDFFYLVMYVDEVQQSRSWNMSYLNNSCDGDWTIGTQVGWTTEPTNGCPNVHTHITRNRVGVVDGLNITVCANDTVSNYACSNSLLYFDPLANLPPQEGIFLSPQNQTFTNGSNIDFNITECIDPNEDTIRYWIHVVNVTDVSNEFNVTSATTGFNYTINSSNISLGTWTAITECCDPSDLCVTFNHSSEWNNFTVETTSTTTTSTTSTSTTTTAAVTTLPGSKIIYQDNTHLHKLLCCSLSRCYTLIDADYVQNTTLFEFNVETIPGLLSCYEIDNDLNIPSNALLKNLSTMFLVLAVLVFFIVFVIVVFQVVRSGT